MSTFLLFTIPHLGHICGIVFPPFSEHRMDPLAERLRKERVARGLSTSELANLTKVREPYIVALERGMYNVLPAVYVRSFIKTLAVALHISPHEIQRLIQQVLDAQDSGASTSRYYQDGPPSAAYSASENIERTSDTVSNLIEQSKSSVQGVYAAMFRRKQSPVKRYAVIAAVLLGLAVAIYVIVKNSSGENGNIDGTAVVEIGAQDSLRLLAITMDTSEFTITIDNKRNEKVLLLPNNEYTWGAMDRFVINNIFNAGAIRFSRNGEPFRQFAKPNEVLRELTITRKEIIASNAPVRPAANGSARPDTGKAPR